MNHLRALERAGAIRRQPRIARGVVLPRPTRNRIVDVPILGRIAAGLADPTEQESLGRLAVDAATLGLPRGANLFALHVRGDSMIDAFIADGDTAILEVREPHHGDVVAALIDGETTLKRYLVTNGAPWLKAENPRYPDLIPAQELVIQGVMVALLRRVGPRR
jgi:repressor LexA